MSNKQPRSTVVTISRHGIYDFRRKQFYYAPWMREQTGRKVCVFSDLFAGSSVQVFDAGSMEYIDQAQARNTAPAKVIVNNGRSHKLGLAI